MRPFVWTLLVTACAHAAPRDTGAREAPVSYRVIEQDVELVAGARKTHGTLARPDAPGRFPAVLLIAGSGPTGGRRH
ncbi:MAG TPA: hypothetical protein VFQ53_09060 [Kofleriaceae bacterium]|nr:hypothetical protein [Kofleriaceae bacterium]